MKQEKEIVEPSDNVIILGAGASYDAGIPLMAGFVEKMWEFSVRKKVNGEPMSSDDIDTFKKAIEIKNELNSYHGRASFDDMNLEDILSILSFNEINLSSSKKSKLFTKAISRTIELTCQVKHDGENKIQNYGQNCYRDFWCHLFINHTRYNKKMPVIISLNYDLVLERALFQFLTGTMIVANDIPVFGQGIEIDYHYEPVGKFHYIIEKTRLNFDSKERLESRLRKGATENPIRIEILKLHGSLNFPSAKTKETLSLVHPIDTPFILPPIINKMSSAKSITNMWAVALQKLRSAKNIIIVGYSLPQTDIYMQYFLKTALGPNLNLNRVYVFDPVLYQQNATSQDSKVMMDRYSSCFSPQLRNKKIIFWPGRKLGKAGGDFKHFVNELNRRDILF